MLGLSFNTKSNVTVFEVFKCQNIIYLLFMPSLTISFTTPLGHEDNRNCKRSAFICVHKQYKNYLCFFVK